MKNKNKLSLIIAALILTLFYACDFFQSEDHKRLKEIDLKDLNKRLNSEKIYFEIDYVVKNDVSERKVNVMVINIKNKEIDLIGINNEFFNLIEEKINIKNYDKIKFWYIDDYSEAKLRILYVYNNKKEIINVYYK